MLLKKQLPLLLLMLIMSAVYQNAFATHIRAGEIIAVRVNSAGCVPARYVFKIIGYTDTSSDVQFGGGLLDFGNGQDPISVSTDFPVKYPLGDGIEVTIFTSIEVEYGTGAYTISFREFNRNAEVVNMSNSVNTPFYIETQIKVDVSIGCNSSPILSVPPVDVAAQGVRFFHNPGAYDLDGDSLSYRFVVCKQDKDRPVVNYEYPHVYDNRTYGAAAIKEDGTTPTTMTLNASNGDLIWDAPAGPGNYNVAFQVVEWRFINGKYREIGYVTRDMQIVVEETDNQRPELTIPNDTCVVAGTSISPNLLTAIISADDVDQGEIKIEAFGGPLNLTISKASISPDAEYQPTVAEVEFNWPVICDHVRDRYYEVTFKATDDGTFHEHDDGRVMAPQHGGTGPKLSDFKTWKINVIGPQPEGLVVVPQSGRKFQLNWDDYSCPNAFQMQVWRRVDSFSFTPEGCETGIPENGGYELIGSVPIGTTSFLDDNDDKGLNFGANYCYRLVAVFPSPSGGISYASDEACAIMEAEGPVITHVSIDPLKTSATDGEISIRWLTPLVIDENVLPPPYTYKVMRANGFNGENGLTEVAVTQDTFLIDSLLNTLDNVYNYRVYLYASDQDVANDDPAIISATASSVRLGSEESSKRIDLSWEAEVPWSNQIQDNPIHYIYRDHVTTNIHELVLIDSVDVTQIGFSYTDEGLFNGIPLSNDSIYCYYITTTGSYGNDDLPIGLLYNNSQSICVQPNDSIPPCPPLSLQVGAPEGKGCAEFISNQNCDFSDFSNIINWSSPVVEECDDDVRSYNIYYSETGSEASFAILATNVRDTFYIDSGLPSFARCYKISAVDRSGNESELSPAICNDNCPNILFPNAFSPNGDSFNNTFRPFSDDNSVGYFDVSNCPRFVKSIHLRVYNRWGNEVFNYQSGGENSILVDWKGVDKNGKPLSAGTYFYVAEVTFSMLNPSGEVRKYKGSVQIIY